MSWFTRQREVPRLPDDRLRTAWQLISLLVDYPTTALVDDVAALRRAAATLPDPVAAPLLSLLATLADTPVADLQRRYVETFDHTRKCSLFLTYFMHGDTRKRGVALVQFKQAYRRAGLEVNDVELPDHLAVVLECGATGDVDVAWKLLVDHRASIEVLRLALADRRSPWADALVALSATLPPLVGDEREAIAKLVAEGPPEEEVGLAPYSIDPRLNPHPRDPAFIGLDEVGVSR